MDITTTNDCCPEYSFKVSHLTFHLVVDKNNSNKGSPDCYEFCEIMNMMNEMADLFGRVRRDEHPRMRRQDNHYLQYPIYVFNNNNKFHYFLPEDLRVVSLKTSS